ncbi:hypothetical protein HYT52_03585 [Candidatus Woesearchaeota archaeon]|nr:hypothetical protein [Candidatus Woesearchaeota archaeon]
MTYLTRIIGGAALLAALTACGIKQEQVKVYERPADPHEWPAWLQSNDKHFVYGNLDLSNDKRYGQEIERFPHEKGPSSDKAVLMLRDAAAITTGDLRVSAGPNERSYTLTGNGYNGANPGHREAWVEMYELADANGNKEVSDPEARNLLEAILDSQLEVAAKAGKK